MTSVAEKGRSPAAALPLSGQWCAEDEWKRGEGLTIKLELSGLAWRSTTLPNYRFQFTQYLHLTGARTRQPSRPKQYHSPASGSEFCD